MTVPDLLVLVQARDIRLEAQGDRLVVDAPCGAVTPELRDQLVQHKAALLGRLAPPQRFVTLNGGLTLPVDALKLALDLEARGIPLVTDQDHQSIVPNDARRTAADHAAIQRWRLQVSAIVDCHAPAELYRL